MVLVAILLLFFAPSSAFKQRTVCNGRMEGCAMVGGRCVCPKSPTENCFNIYPFPDLNSCLEELFKTGPDVSTIGYPTCIAAQHQKICNTNLARTKYCDGSCENRCCLVGDDGCLPPTNIFVPADSCLTVITTDTCKGYTCSKGFKCAPSVGNCPVLPCPRVPSCIVDNDYNPCQYMRCAGDKVCRRERTKCNQVTCPFTHRCLLSKEGCAGCRQLSIQESYCANNFVAKIRLVGLKNTDTWHYALSGPCDWYEAEVEMVYQQKKPSALTTGNVTILVKGGKKCSCVHSLSRIGQKYLVIGQYLDYTWEGNGSVVFVPEEGYINPWTAVHSMVIRPNKRFPTLRDSCHHHHNHHGGRN